MRTDRRLLSALTLLCAIALASCDGSLSGPAEVPESELLFTRAAADAPPLAAAQVQVWAKAGDGRRIQIDYAKVGEYGGDRCLEFDIPSNALLRRPDGTPFARGDSVLITIRVVDASRFDFEFSPSGLRFDPDHPAELRVSYKWADPDYNGDGRVDDRDRLRSLAIWRQEAPGLSWRRIGTRRDGDVQELRADIEGFSKYAMASN